MFKHNEEKKTLKEIKKKLTITAKQSKKNAEEHEMIAKNMKKQIEIMQEQNDRLKSLIKRT